MKRFRFFVLLALLSVLAAGCGDDGKRKQTSPSAGKANKAEPVVPEK